VSERAVNLAIVLLTRFHAVHVERAYSDSGYDLRVLVDFNKPNAGEFGVRLEGYIGPILNDGRADSQFIEAARKSLKGCDFPVALLEFDVKSDKGRFGWLLAPKVIAHRAQLEETETVSLEPATNQRIQGALEEFRRWHKVRLSQANGSYAGSR